MNKPGAAAAALLAEHAALHWTDWQVGEVTLRSASKVGTRGHPGADPALRLLADALKRGRLPLAESLGRGGQVLDLSGTALLPVWAAATGLQAHWTLVSTSAAEAAAMHGSLEAAASSLASSSPTSLATTPRLALPWEVDGVYDAVIWCPPAERGWRRVQAELLTVASRLAPGGTVWLLQDKDLGAQRTEREARRYFGEVETLARDGGWRLSALRDRSFDTLPPAETDGSFEAEDGPVRAVVGTYASAAVDPGTALLLSSLPTGLAEGQRVLDLGCGTGLLARRALRHGASEVVALDDDLGAVRSATWQLQAEQAEHWQGLHADLGLGMGLEGFDQVWCNPPFHVGRQVVGALSRAFVAAAELALRPGGELWLVANRALPYEAELASWSAWRDRTPPGEQRFKLLWARR